jgi:hypothetical protein
MRLVEKQTGSREVLGFERVKSFKDLALAVIQIEGEYINTGWSPEKPGEPEKGVMTNKLDWLLDEKKHHLDEWWIYDGKGGSHNLGQIVRKINPDWCEGDSWTNNVDEKEKLKQIEGAWLEAGYMKASAIAGKYGGTAYAISGPSMEAGICAVVVLKEDERDGEVLFRGVRHQGDNVLTEQVSGMLRVGVNREGQEALGHVGTGRWSVTVDDMETRQTVSRLAENPNEDEMERLIDMYHDRGFDELCLNATDALESIKRRMKRQHITFVQAVIDNHVDLLEGNIGNSPFVAMTSDMGEVVTFTGKSGTIVVANMEEGRVSPTKVRGKEKLVRGWVDVDEIVAVLPVDRLYREKDRMEGRDVKELYSQIGRQIVGLIKKQG